jgi:hypothetical protein
MSSRRGAAQARNALQGTKGLPPSHPKEQSASHRAFLIRSLERNDAETAALVDLHQTLVRLRQRIVDTRPHGAAFLLALGRGTLRLDPSGNDRLEHVAHDDDNHHHDWFANTSPTLRRLGVEFLLRRKLRRQLLNRLARRLNRIAHVMDGEDVGVPALPKYGELRLHVQDDAVAALVAHWERQDQARIRIQAARETATNLSERSVGDPAPLPQQQACGGGANEAEPRDEHPVKVEDPSDTKETPVDATVPTPAEHGPSTAASPHPETHASITPAPHEADPVPSHTDPSDAMQLDYEAFRDYKDVYDKVWNANPVGNQPPGFAYLAAAQPIDEASFGVTAVAGVNATNRHMTLKEKQAEFMRWQTSLLAKIPDQPTFADLGLDNRVFCWEQRYQQAWQEATEDNNHTSSEGEDARDPQQSPQKVNEATDSGSAKKLRVVKKEDHSDDDDAMEVESDPATDEQQETKSPTKTVGKEDAKLETPQKPERKEEEAKEHARKIVKPISLAAVPSFYDQDLERIKWVHAELMSTSIRDHARQRIHEVTKEYNNALRVSNELHDRRQRAESQYQMFAHESRNQLTKIKIEYQNDFAVYKSRYLQRRREFEQKKLAQLLPSKWGRNPEGTHATRLYTARPNAIANQVGSCLADVVDAVDLVAQGKLTLTKFQEPFNPPQPPNIQGAIDPKTGETITQRNKRVEEGLKQEVNTLALKLRNNEEERQKAWRRMLKTKAEFDLPHQGTGSSRAQVRVDLNNYHQVALPPLRQSSTQSVPQEVAARVAVLPSYTPVQSQYYPMGGGDNMMTMMESSKYSAARVKERISADGTVAPVTEPKLNKDGLYLRPAGRTRKGMEWDAVRGIWVPANNNPGGYNY